MFPPMFPIQFPIRVRESLRSSRGRPHPVAIGLPRGGLTQLRHRPASGTERSDPRGCLGPTSLIEGSESPCSDRVAGRGFDRGIPPAIEPALQATSRGRFGLVPPGHKPLFDAVGEVLDQPDDEVLRPAVDV